MRGSRATPDMLGILRWTIHDVDQTGRPSQSAMARGVKAGIEPDLRHALARQRRQRLAQVRV
jgi:hypothetical protein